MPDLPILHIATITVNGVPQLRTDSCDFKELLDLTREYMKELRDLGAENVRTYFDRQAYYGR